MVAEAEEVEVEIERREVAEEEGLQPQADRLRRRPGSAASTTLTSESSWSRLRC